MQACGRRGGASGALQAEHSWQQEHEAQHRDVVPSQLPTEQRVQQEIISVCSAPFFLPPFRGLVAV